MRKHLSWKDFGGTMRRLRLHEHLSQDRLAEVLGYHRTYIWRLENGQRRPSRSFIHALAYTCQLTEEDKTTLSAFEQMIEYGCNDGEIGE